VLRLSVSQPAELEARRRGWRRGASCTWTSETRGLSEGFYVNIWIVNNNCDLIEEVYHNIRIMINNCDPNEGTICKICGPSRSRDAPPPLAIACGGGMRSGPTIPVENPVGAKVLQVFTAISLEAALRAARASPGRNPPPPPWILCVA
jgi:hypothetical protein